MKDLQEAAREELSLSEYALFDRLLRKAREKIDWWKSFQIRWKTTIGKD